MLHRLAQFRNVVLYVSALKLTNHLYLITFCFSKTLQPKINNFFILSILSFMHILLKITEILFVYSWIMPVLQSGFNLIVYCIQKNRFNPKWTQNTFTSPLRKDITNMNISHKTQNTNHSQLELYRVLHKQSNIGDSLLGKPTNHSTTSFDALRKQWSAIDCFAHNTKLSSTGYWSVCRANSLHMFYCL